MEHYLDNSATTRVCPEAAEAALDAMLNTYGNPSSTYTKGREAKKLLDRSRKAVAAALGCDPTELVFTSCGSESDNWALLGSAESMQRKGKHIITSLVEHDAVRNTAAELERRGYELMYLKPDSTGRIDPESVRAALRPDTILVSLMLVNNETGAVTDISAVSSILKEENSPALLHTDAVQGFMKLDFTVRSLGADLVSISGHKIHAPKGIGALYIRKGLRLRPFIFGGAQEDGRRAGTEAMPQIAAFGEAARIAKAGLKENTAHMCALKAELIQRLPELIPDIHMLDTDAPHILSVSLPGFRSEVLMNFLEAREIYVSRSSACKKGARSHVLEAIGMEPRLIDGALRIGLCRYNTREDINTLVEALGDAYRTLAHR
ncbi:MAG: cysteine desulfurase [Oscillospiraceae bacterium]|nr:cysteine desulfurase [Oscillospiraceae bacterium]